MNSFLKNKRKTTPYLGNFVNIRKGSKVLFICLISLKFQDFFSPFLSGLKNLIYQTVGDTSKITSGAEKTISFLHSVIRNGRAKYSGATSQLPEQGHNLRDINALLSPDFSAVTQPLSLRVALREFSPQR